MATLVCLWCDAVPMDMDVRMKTVLLGAVFLIVSLRLMHKKLKVLFRFFVPELRKRRNGETE